MVSGSPKREFSHMLIMVNAHLIRNAVLETKLALDCLASSSPARLASGAPNFSCVSPNDCGNMLRYNAKRDYALRTFLI